jgi:hypothetical protein
MNHVRLAIGPRQHTQVSVARTAPDEDVIRASNAVAVVLVIAEVSAAVGTEGPPADAEWTMGGHG